MTEPQDREAVHAAWERLHGHPWREPVRYSVDPSLPMVEFFVTVMGYGYIPRRKGAAQRWRREQWRLGNRTCAYCEVDMIKPHKVEAPIDRTATVDHKQPLARKGLDCIQNWAMCCWGCNNRKGSMTEAEFRSLLACEAT